MPITENTAYEFEEDSKAIGQPGVVVRLWHTNMGIPFDMMPHNNRPYLRTWCKGEFTVLTKKERNALMKFWSKKDV